MSLIARWTTDEAREKMALAGFGNLSPPVPNSACLRSEKVRLNTEQGEVVVAKSCGRKSDIFSYREDGDFVTAVKEGFELEERWLFKQGNVAVLSLRKEEDSSLHMGRQKLAFVDTSESGMRLLGCMAVRTPDVTEWVQHVELYNCAVSKDGARLAVVYGVLSKCDSALESCIVRIAVFDTRTKTSRSIYECADSIVPTVAFDPSHLHSRLAVGGIRGEVSAYHSIGVYCLCKGAMLKQRPLPGKMLDFDAEQMLSLHYTADGSRMLLHVLESLSFHGDFSATSYVVDTETLRVIHKIRPGVILLPCHVHCPVELPVLVSQSGTTMMVLDGDRTENRNHYVFRLPDAMNLKQMCRGTILRHLHKMAAIEALPVPDDIQRYLHMTTTDV